MSYECDLSVLEGVDSQALEILFRVHAPQGELRILDCTYNDGKIWSETTLKPTVTMDIDPTFKTDVVGSFTEMPFEDHSFDIIVFDPPHLPTHAASENSSRMWERCYGITDDDPARDADHVCALFTPFLREAQRVLVPKGIILAKLSDLTHNHRYQWQHIEFVMAAGALGMTPCDMLIKRDPKAGRLKSSKWQNAKHLRKCHCYWIVVRNGKKCERD